MFSVFHKFEDSLDHKSDYHMEFGDYSMVMPLSFSSNILYKNELITLNFSLLIKF